MTNDLIPSKKEMKHFKDQTTSYQITIITLLLSLTTIVLLFLRYVIGMPMESFFYGKSAHFAFQHMFLGYVVLWVVTFAGYVLWKIPVIRAALETLYQWMSTESTPPHSLLLVGKVSISFQYLSTPGLLRRAQTEKSIIDILTANPDTDVTKHEAALRIKVIAIERPASPQPPPPLTATPISPHDIPIGYTDDE